MAPTTSKKSSTAKKSSTSKKPSDEQNKGHKLEQIDSGAHPKIEDDLPNAIKGKYCGKFLSKTLRDNAMTEIKTRLGDSEMRILGLPIPAIETEAQAKAMMIRFFPIFDKAFFINLDGKIVTDPVEIYEDSEDTGKFCYSGDHIIRLNMSIPDCKSPLGEKLLCVLLHEMLHVFLEYYTCKCRKCEKRTARTGGPGKTNHGFAFCNAMMSLQEALQREVKWKVDCDLAHSVRVEMEASGWEPTEQQLKRWGLADEITQRGKSKKPGARKPAEGQVGGGGPGRFRNGKDLKRVCCTMM